MAIDRRLRRLFWGSGGGGSSTLLDGLSTLYRLDETSGTRYDQVGSDDLTDVNTVGYDTGLIGNSTLHVPANGEYLISATTATLGLSQDITVAGWIYPFDIGDYVVWSKDVSGGGYARTWILRMTAAGQGLFTILDTAVQNVAATTAGSVVTANQWNLIVGKFISSEKKGYVSVNAGSWSASAALSGTPQTGNCPLVVGSHFSLGTYRVPNGQVDMCAGWTKECSDSEVAEYYNSGAGFDPTA